MNALTSSRMNLMPDTARIEARPCGERLTIASCDLEALAAQHGTPLYLYDRATLEAMVSTYRAALATHYPGSSGLTYAGKAFLCSALVQWADRSGLWVDFAGEGELQIAAKGGMSRERTLVHGVNKSPADLAAALVEAGTLVVDNLPELEAIVALQHAAPDHLPNLWLRFRPGLAVDTHAHTQTGQAQSKFGMDAGEWLRAAVLCHRHGLPLKGIHFHQGSHFTDPTPLRQAIGHALDLLVAAGAGRDWTLCPGGGWGVAYHEDDLPQPDIEAYVRTITECVVEGCQPRRLSLPHLQLEPGRSLVARAGVALYRVGTVKEAGGRRWLLLDGGLTDNPRPALYGARYSALPVQGPQRPVAGRFWLGGPFCESGDVLIRDLELPDTQAGELLAVPVSGAYQLSMSSNYNGARRPAVVWLDDGEPTLIQTREAAKDLVRRDRLLS